MRKLWCLRCIQKTGNVKAEEIWVASLFQKQDAVDENDFEVAIDVFLNGADMVMEEEEEDRSDSEGVYLGRIWARYKGCWRCSTLKAVVAILKLIRWRTGSQCRPTRTGVAWCGSTETFVQQLRQECSEPTEGKRDLMRRCLQKRITIVKTRADLRHGYRFCCFSGQGWTECGAELECENMMPYKSRKHAYRKTYESLGKHLDFL